MLAELSLLRPYWLLALLPLLVLWVWLARRALRARRWEDLIDPHLRDAVLSADGERGLWTPLILFAVGSLLVLAALSGPVWQRQSRPIYRIEQPRVLVMDLSPDMNPGNQPVTGLQRARFEVLDLLRFADEGQIALIGYGSEPFVIAPLTTDAATIIEQVPALAPDLLPMSGLARVDLALDMAASLMRRSGAVEGDVILVAGALPWPERALEAAARLRAAGHRLSVLAVADVPAFEPLVRAGGGLLLQARVDALDTERLLALANNQHLTPVNDRMTNNAEWRDQGYWLLLLALPLAALAFRRGWLGLLPIVLLLPPAPVCALSWQDLWLRPEQQALRDLEGNAAAAINDRFSDPDWRAAAHYRAGRYQQALQSLSGLSGAEAHYNRGNTLAQLRRFAAAIAEYDAALSSDPNHQDARHNRDLLMRYLGLPSDSAIADTSRPASQTSTLGSNRAEMTGDAELAGQMDRSGTPQEVKRSDPSTSPQPQMQTKRSKVDTPPDSGTAAAITQMPVASNLEEQPGLPSRMAANRKADQTLSSGGNGASSQLDHPADDAADRMPAGNAAGAISGPADSMQTRNIPSAAGSDAADARLAYDAVDYLLRQVPDDPAGLLRARLLLQYLRRHGQLQ